MIEWATDFIPLSVPLLSILLGAGITWSILPVIIRISHEKNLVDAPILARKLHNSYTPNLGGVAFYFSLLTVFLFSGYASESWTAALIGGLTVLFFAGLKDDILVLSPRIKLAIQVISVLALTVGGGIVINDLGGVFGINEIPEYAGIALTCFTMIVVINAYNLIDGIDGLAGSVGLIASLFFGIWFWYTGYNSQAVLAFTSAGTLCAFLRYNYQPASIFMGDTGSHVIGYMLAFLAVSFVKIGVTTSASVPFQSSIPVLVLAVLIVPLYDTLRVFIIRLFRKSSPFKADRLHVHHQILDLGFSHASACYIIAGLNLGIISLTALLDGMNVNVILIIMLTTSAFLFPTMGLKRKLFSAFGIAIPSSLYINLLKRKYGVQTHDSTPHNPPETTIDSDEEQEFEKIAV